mgnify:CR=1 FL=1
MNAAHPEGEALAVAGGRILALGSANEVEALANKVALQNTPVVTRLMDREEAIESGAMAVDDANTVDAPAHDIVGIRAAIPLRVRAWTVRLHGGVDNVLDAPWVASVVPNAFGGRFFEPGPGRSFHVGLGIAGTP